MLSQARPYPDEGKNGRIRVTCPLVLPASEKSVAPEGSDSVTRSQRVRELFCSGLTAPSLCFRNMLLANTSWFSH